MTASGAGTADRFMKTVQQHLAWARRGRARVQAKRRAAAKVSRGAWPNRAASRVSGSGTPRPVYLFVPASAERTDSLHPV